MRTVFATVVLTSVVAAGCSKSENAGAEEAKKQSEAEVKSQAAASASKKIRPPVPGNAKIPCEQLIDVAAFQRVMEEPEALTVRDKKEDGDAAAACAVIRGGARPSKADQAKLLKEKGRLGVMPGDEICYVNAYCWTIEDLERFKTKCKARKDADDDSMGSYACRQLVMVGADDVFVYSFFDEDTKCILKVGGGPSNVDNELIKKCATAARDAITPAQIAVGDAAAAAAAKPAETAPAADGSAAGSAGSAN